MFRVVLMAVVVSVVGCGDGDGEGLRCTRNDDCMRYSCCVVADGETDGFCVSQLTTPGLAFGEGCLQACDAFTECDDGLTCFAGTRELCTVNDPQGSCVIAEGQPADADRCEVDDFNDDDDDLR